MEQEQNNSGNSSGLHRPVSSGHRWAVIDSGTRRLVGQVLPPVSLGGQIVVSNAVELETSITRIPHPQGLANLGQPIMIPLDLEDRPVTIQVLVNNIRWFDEMEDRGRSYLILYETLENQMVQERAKKAGLEIAKTKIQAPRG
jgi:hypothetical protein